MGKRTAVSNVIDDLLVVVAAAGTIGLCIAAPNSVSALEKPLGKLLTGRKQTKETRRLAYYLKQQKLVKVVTNDDGTYQVTLEEKGAARTSRVRFERLAIPRSDWDMKWRVITFDIPEKHKSIRDYISKHLRLIGFKQLQRSVFIYPYPIDEFVVILREQFPEVEDNVSYMLVEDIDQHNKLVKQFSSIL